jgi:hypothetical protein
VYFLNNLHIRFQHEKYYILILIATVLHCILHAYGPARLQEYLHHLNSLRPTIKSTMEVEVNDTLLLGRPDHEEGS